MFNDIGKKIKKVAKSIFIYELVLAIIIGIILIFLGVDALAGGEYLIMLGIFSIIIGPIVAWLSAFLLYGFGELVDKTCEIEFNTRHPQKNAPPQEESVSFKAKKSAPELKKTKSIEPEVTLVGDNERKRKCDICEKENVPVVEYKIKDKMGTRYINMCKDCRKEYDAYI